MVVGHAFFHVHDALQFVTLHCLKLSSWDGEHCHDAEESIVGCSEQCWPSQHVEKHLASEEKFSWHELVHVVLVICVCFTERCICFFAIFFDVFVIREQRYFQIAIAILLEEMLLQRAAAPVRHKHLHIRSELSHGQFAL